MKKAVLMTGQCCFQAEGTAYFLDVMVCDDDDHVMM